MGKFLNQTGRPILYYCEWPLYDRAGGIKVRPSATYKTEKNRSKKVSHASWYLTPHPKIPQTVNNKQINSAETLWVLRWRTFMTPIPHEDMAWRTRLGDYI